MSKHCHAATLPRHLRTRYKPGRLGPVHLFLKARRPARWQRSPHAQHPLRLTVGDSARSVRVCVCVRERLLASLEEESMPNVGEERPIQSGHWPVSASVHFSGKISSSLCPNSPGHRPHLMPKQRWEVTEYKYFVTELDCTSLE